MVERNLPVTKVVSRKSLCCFFTMTTLFFIMSWLFVLRSTRSQTNFDTLSQLLSTFDDTNSQNNNDESSFGNRTILVNNNEPITTTTHTHDDVDVNPTKTQTQNPQTETEKCSSSSSLSKVLKVFMYDLPAEFHFGLLDWKPEGRSVWPDMNVKVPNYPGGLNLQHSIEYWLTLEILASESNNKATTSSVIIRVRNSSESDVIFVPFFSSLSYNRHSKTGPHEKKSKNKVLQEKLVRYLMGQEEWKRSGGRDHVIMAHHPNSMLDARMKLWPATFILSDFGRYPPNIANVEKDVIAPYKHVVGTYVDDSSSFDSRKTLMYFQGAIYRKDVCSSLPLSL